MNFFALILGVLFWVGGPTGWAQDLAKVRTTLKVKEKVWVGQRVTLIIELLSPGYFAGSPAFDLPSVPGILILQPDGRPVLGSEMIDHTSYTIQ